MTRLVFEMRPYDFNNAKNVIGPFHLDDDIEYRLYSDVVYQLGHGTFNVGTNYRPEIRNGELFLVVDERISYELETIIKDILGQDEDVEDVKRPLSFLII